VIITVGPGDGTLSLHTGRAGAVSKAGHDLTLQISQWTATATMSESGELRHLRVVALVGSLQVIRGEGGLKPLSDADRATILSNAQSTMKAAKHPRSCSRPRASCRTRRQRGSPVTSPSPG